MLKPIQSTFVAFFLICIISGCSESFPKEKIHAEKIIKIAVPEGNWFELNFLPALVLKYPEVTFELVRDGYISTVESGNWEIWLEAHQPDLIVSYYPGMYSQLIQSGLLLPLDSLIERDKFDLSSFVPGAIEWLRMNDPNRQIYGLAIDFQNCVLLYNPEHFDQLGIEYPQLKMTWFDLLELAQRFQYDGQQVYGLQHHAITPFRFITEIGRTEELQLYSIETGEVYVRTDAWKSIWEKVLEAYKSKSIKNGTDFFPTDVAMVIKTIFMGYEFWELTDTHWKIAYFPINENNPNESHSLTVNRPISIYNKSTNTELAWDIIKFLVGEDMIRYINPKYLAGMPLRTESIEQTNIENIRVLYDINPKPNTIPDISKYIPTIDKLRYLYDMGDRIFMEILEGNRTLDEGLEEFELELKELIYQSIN